MINNLCNKCNNKAVWFYMPSSDIQYCDDCVPRGCSCNIIEESCDEQETDELARQFPCCEYMYDNDNE